MKVVVVGASLAGLRAAQALRAAGFDDDLVMVGDEVHEPYDRPPLSKELLTGERDVDGVRLWNDTERDALGVELVLGTRATSLDAAARAVHVDGREPISYDELIIATGARARRMAACDGPEGIHVLRTIEDAVAIRDAMATSSGLAVVGGGFIGSEVASSARSRGLPTTVLEAMDTPLGRVLDGRIGGRLGRLHADQGSELRCGVGVVGPVGGDRVEGVRLADGSTVDADLVIIGVGSIPNTEWLSGSGLDVSHGVRCDANGAAAGVNHVHALGDVARWDSARFGDAVRTEHWTSAGDQAQAVAAHLLGRPPPEEAVPYVWSDQFGRRIQVGGRGAPDDEVHVVHDDDDRYLAITGRDGRLASVVALDDPKAFGRLRRLIARQATWDDALAETNR